MLTDKEIDQKLTQHGLPLYGTMDEKIARLVRNGLHAAEKATGETGFFNAKGDALQMPVDVKYELDEKGKIVGSSLNGESQEEMLANAHAEAEAAGLAPRKPGRPKKGK